MSEKSETINARRRLDLSSATAKRTTKVKNPYLKDPKSAHTNTQENAPTTSTSTITPEAGIEKFFVSKREAGDSQPRAARKLVTPRENDVLVGESEKAKGLKRKSLEFSSDDDANGLYYHSDTESRTNNMARKKKLYYPDHIHYTLDYHHRGELPLDQGTLKAYRFIRQHFLIPCDIESDPKFGAYSGSCFEERAIRAYSLGQLEPKKSNQSESSLLVCSYCGDVGHKRERCLKLL